MRTRVERTNAETRLRRVADAYGRVLVLVVAALPAGVAAGAADALFGRVLLTVLTLSAGYQGGEVTPLFSIGTCLGVALAGPLGLPVALAAALGYAAVFGAATNTFLAPLLIGGEVFGWANLSAFFVVCAAAYLFNMGKTIYAGQLPG